MRGPAPNIRINEDLNIEKLDLKVDNITVIAKASGDSGQSGSSLKLTFSYKIGDIIHKTDNLRIRLEGGKMKRVSPDRNKKDFGSFTIIPNESKTLEFFKYVHEKIIDYLHENAKKIQPLIFISALSSFDNSVGVSLAKFKNNLEKKLSAANEAVSEYEGEKLKDFSNHLRNVIEDTFRLTRKEAEDWCLLKPANQSDDFIMNLSAYRRRGVEPVEGSAPAYDFKVFEIEDGKNRLVKDDEEVEGLIGCSNTNGMIEYDNIVLEMKRPHMRASEKNISFGWIIRFIGVSSVEEVEYDPINDVYITKSEAAKRERESDQNTDSIPDAKKHKPTPPPSPKEPQGDASEDDAPIEQDDGIFD